MNFPKPKNWVALTNEARQAAIPHDIDVRHAVRAEITLAGKRPVVSPSEHWGLLDELVALANTRWLQAGLACTVFFSAWSLSEGTEIIRELDALWSLGGPLMSQI